MSLSLPLSLCLSLSLSVCSSLIFEEFSLEEELRGIGFHLYVPDSPANQIGIIRSSHFIFVNGSEICNSDWWKNMKCDYKIYF